MSTEGLQYTGYFKPAQPPATNNGLRSFFAEEAKNLASAFGFKDIVEIMHKEEADWMATWQRNPNEALALYRREREMRLIMNELIWAIVNKHGGEVRLGARDLAPIDWELLETYDMETQEKMFKTRVKPEPKEAA